MRSGAIPSVCVSVLAVACGADVARAQTCGNPATNVVAASGVCVPTVRISWTNPPGLVNPKVWRTATSQFVNPTLIYVTGSGGATTHFHTPPATNTVHYYWVGGDIFLCNGVNTAQPLPMVGPLPAGVFDLSQFPPPVATAACDGVRLDWLPSWGATSMTINRVSDRINTQIVSVATVLPSITTYTDVTASAANGYTYGLFPTGPCGTANSAAGTIVRAGPFSAVQSVGTVANVGETATLTVTNALDGLLPPQVPAPLFYLWMRNGVSLPADGGTLPSGARVFGANTRTLTLQNVKLEDAGEYTLRITGACPDLGSGQFNWSFHPTFLAVQQPCRADHDQSGSLAPADIFNFLNDWFAGCP